MERDPKEDQRALEHFRKLQADTGEEPEISHSEDYASKYETAYDQPLTLEEEIANKPKEYNPRTGFERKPRVKDDGILKLDIFRILRHTAGSTRATCTKIC